jgi:hypothetical protein
VEPRFPPPDSAVELEPFKYKHLSDIAEKVCAKQQRLSNVMRTNITAAMNRDGWLVADAEPITLHKDLTLACSNSIALSREDIVPNFWSDGRSERYLTHLGENPRIVQTRIRIVRAPDLDPHGYQKRFKAIAAASGGEYFVVDSDKAKPIRSGDSLTIEKLRYGATIFFAGSRTQSEPQFVALPAAPLTLYDLNQYRNDPLELLGLNGDHNPSGKMQTILIFNPATVRAIAKLATALILLANPREV